MNNKIVQTVTVVVSDVDVGILQSWPLFGILHALKFCYYCSLAAFVVPEDQYLLARRQLGVAIILDVTQNLRPEKLGYESSERRTAR